MSTSKRLSQVYKSSQVLPFDDYSRIVIMSDCHRGDGGWTDNFSANQHLFFAALTFYFERGYSYVELGDGDELWENRSIETIINMHSDVFWLMSQFYKLGRLYMIFGNHDIVKKDPKYSSTKCSSFFCDSCNSVLPLFPGIEIPEGLVLRYNNSNNEIFLTHGHQADILNDKFWRFARFLVRYLWRPLELLGIRDPTSAAKNNHKKNKIEKRIIDWSEKNNQMIITGHTHRPIFPAIGEPLSINTGSCIHPRCITAIEIINGTICLVKWAVMTRADRTLYVGREVLEAPISLMAYFNSKG